MKKICLKIDDLDFENTDKIEFNKNREMMFLYPELLIEHYRTPQKEKIISSTVITYKSKPMGKTFRCISNKNAETLAFIIDQNGFISLYYDPNNLDDYFFDLNGNS